MYENLEPLRHLHFTLLIFHTQNSEYQMINYNQEPSFVTSTWGNIYKNNNY